MKKAALLLTLVALSLAACESEFAASGSDYPSYYDDGTVTYVSEEAYPTRTYFYEPSDYAHVYYYENSYPDYVYYRSVYRDHDRPYFVEYDRDRERRTFFNDRRARESRFDRPNRDRALNDARSRDRDRVSDWASRHETNERRR